MYEEDDVVVLEGTPLGNYFNDIGLNGVEEKKEEEDVHQNMVYSLLHKARVYLSEVFSSSKDKAIRECYLQLSLDEILRGGIIDELDVTPVLLAHGLQIGVKESDILRIFSRKALMDILLVLVPGAAMTFAGKKTLTTKLITASPIAAMLISWWPLWKAHKSYLKLKNYMANLKQLHQNLKKACRLINDTSIINKGYVFNTNSAGAWRLECRDLQSLSVLSENCLPGLRVVVRSVTTRLALAYSKDLQEQRELNPLPFNLDHPSVCLPDFEEQLTAKMRDESIPSLREMKDAVDTYLLKEKEYMKRVVLTLLTSDMAQSFSLKISTDIFSSVEKSLEEINLSSMLYKTMYCDDEKSMLKVQSTFCEGYNPLETMCRSSCLHIEKALKVAITIEKSVANENCDPRALNDIHQNLSEVDFHITAAKECLKRITVLTVKASSKESDSAEPIVSRQSQVISEGGVKSDSDVNVHFDPPSPTDEVYELVGERLIVEEQDEDTLDSDRRVVDEESSRLMLKELKNVLRVKALDWEQREQKLRERTQGGKVSSTSTKVDIEDTVELVNKPEKPSSLQKEGECASLSSWVIPVVGELSATQSREEGLLDEAAGFDPRWLGSLASEAVARAKLNQAAGYVSHEESFISEDD